MRDIKKIKVFDNKDKYSFSLNSKQLVSLVLVAIGLSVILFFTGFFIGNQNYELETLNCNPEDKNLTIVTNDSKKNKLMTKYITSNKEEQETKIENKKETKVENKKETNKKFNPEDENLVIKTKLDKKNIEKPKQEIKSSLDNKSEKNSLASKIKNNSIKKDEDLINIPDLSAHVGSGDNVFKTSLKTSSSGNYVLQVKATTQYSDAKILKEKLETSGYNSFIEKVNSRGTVYNRVRIGFFKNKNIALSFKEDFEKESGFKNTFITRKSR